MRLRNCKPSNWPWQPGVAHSPLDIFSLRTSPPAYVSPPIFASIGHSPALSLSVWTVNMNPKEINHRGNCLGEDVGGTMSRGEMTGSPATIYTEQHLQPDDVITRPDVHHYTWPGELIGCSDGTDGRHICLWDTDAPLSPLCPSISQHLHLARTTRPATDWTERWMNELRCLVMLQLSDAKKLSTFLFFKRLKKIPNFCSRSYCIVRLAIGIRMSPICLSIRPSVCLWRCALWLNNTSCDNQSYTNFHPNSKPTI